MSGKYYQKTTQSVWTGRVDHETDLTQMRWHQKIICTTPDELVLDLSHNPPTGRIIVLIGFSCDEGIRRNQGRVGAADGPQALRQFLVNLPWSFAENTFVYDVGDVVCVDGDLEGSREELSQFLARFYALGIFPVVLGGGHELAFPHGKAVLESASSDSVVGIINFDAHFDLRPLRDGKAHSGSPFLELSHLCESGKRDFRYLCLGIQASSNTPHLFQTAKDLKVVFHDRLQIAAESKLVHESLLKFIKDSDKIYLSVCLDVLAEAVAPGVSAPTPFGLDSSELLQLLKPVLLSGKVVGFDLAELSPPLDLQGKTARLAAHLMHAIFRGLRH